MRKKKRLITAVICIAVVGCAAAIWLAGRKTAKKPFRDLEPADIAFATVTLTPPDLTVEVPDLEELTTLLRAVEIWERDDSYTECCGQGVTFTLHMTDGSCMDAMAFNPFFVLNGKGYRTAYEPCEALNRYANGLLEQENPRYFLESPPDLTVVSDQTAVGGLLGSHSWEYPQGDGSTVNVLADSVHPLDAREFLAGLDTTESTGLLRFAVEPQEILEVRCWSDDCWGNPDAESETAALRDGTLELWPGGWIYEIQAQWALENGCGGTASYAFYVIRH